MNTTLYNVTQLHTNYSDYNYVEKSKKLYASKVTLHISNDAGSQCYVGGDHRLTRKHFLISFWLIVRASCTFIIVKFDRVVT